ncbi:hypothetical protein [Methylotenera sp.]|uniref:hypothetical protein n=1 Tax=Methylotenera sp. TaxID=2051956 RepID=UPI0027361023|nr:hypothetical protein [Methylotenera sp.]MDP3210397.1 hypothetical protein [Methylotenera sp.]
MPKIVIDRDSKKEIIRMIDSWKGKLSWEELCIYISNNLGLDNIVSRHTLLRHDDIKIAFANKKKILKETPTNNIDIGDKALEKAYERIKTLEAKNSRLEKEISVIKEQFVRWQHNLYKYNYDMNLVKSRIDEVLPDFDRANRKNR